MFNKKECNRNRTKSCRGIWRKRGIALFMTACMLAGLLTGCGNSKETSDNGKGLTAKGGVGRYEEKEMELPSELDSTNVFQLTTEEDIPVLYVKSGVGSGTLKLQRYIYTDNWKEDTPDCMKNITIKESTYNQIKVIKNGEDYYVFYTANVNDEESQGFLMTCRADGQVEDVTPSEWGEEDPDYHFIDTPQDVVVTEDGILVASFYTKICLYHAADMSLVKTITPEEQYMNQMSVIGKDYVMLGQNNETGNPDGIYQFHTDEDKPEKTEFSTKQSGSVAFTVLKDRTIVVATADGFYEKKEGNDELGMIIDGVYTSFSLSSIWCQNIIGTDDGKFMALFEDTSGKQYIYLYEFNESLSTTPDHELTVYTLYESSTLKQAAGMFSKIHPDTVVNIHVAFPDVYRVGGVDQNVDTTEEVKRLNTDLISKGGEDILILDGLDTDVLVEKGFLVDLSDAIKPMQDSGELLDNMIESEKQEDGKLPMVPLRFAMDIVVAKDRDASSVADVQSLADALSKESTSMIGPHTSDDLVDMFAPYFTNDIVKNKKLDEQALKTNLTYLKQIADNCGIVNDYGDSNRAYNIWEIASKVNMAIYYDEGFAEAMFPLSAAKLVKGSFSSFENAYYPLFEAGVNVNSKQQDLAKEFITFALTQKVQDGDFYDGYPVNINSLVVQQKMDHSAYAACTDIEVGDGQYTEFTIDEFNANEGEQLTNFCKKLNKKAITDKMINKEIKKAIPEYFAGTKSVDETVKQIEEALHIYLAE